MAQPRSEIGQSRSERFWAKVDRSGGPDACWPWTACRNERGYGYFWTGRVAKAHRVAYELSSGLPPPAHLDVCHRCDNPRCCNQTHFFLGTRADNTADMLAKGRGADFRGENNGRAKLTAEQVREIRATSGLLREAAARFGVTMAQVSDIRRGKSWAHVS